MFIGLLKENLMEAEVVETSALLKMKKLKESAPLVTLKNGTKAYLLETYDSDQETHWVVAGTPSDYLIGRFKSCKAIYYRRF